MKFRIVMIQPQPKPENPFLAGLINRTTPTRTAELEADSEQAVREFFADAKRRDFPTVRGYELESVTAL
jgi:hypothetical protein